MTLILVALAALLVGALAGAVLATVFLGPRLVERVPPFLERVLADAVASLGSEREWDEIAKELSDRLDGLAQDVHDEHRWAYTFQDRHSARLDAIEEQAKAVETRLHATRATIAGAGFVRFDDDGGPR